MTRARSDVPGGPGRHGLAFHLSHTSDSVWLEGHDAGVSFASVHRPSTAVTFMVFSNWSEGAWPIVTLLADRLDR